MFKFRGQRKDGRYVIGYLTKGIDEYYIEDISTHDEMIFPTVVSKESLSVSTGKLDSNGAEIFASFEVEGKMTEGGDVFNPENGEYFYNVVFEYGRFFAALRGYDSKHRLGIGWEQFSEFTIIGKQGGGNE